MILKSCEAADHVNNTQILEVYRDGGAFSRSEERRVGKECED